MLPSSTCGCFLLQKEHGFTNLTTITSTEKNYNSEAILLIRNPFRTIILNRQRGTEGLGIKKTLFIANEGNKQTNNSFRIISSQLLVFNFIYEVREVLKSVMRLRMCNDCCRMSSRVFQMNEQLSC